jgi:hypothetical protein
MPVGKCAEYVNTGNLEKNSLSLPRFLLSIHIRVISFIYNEHFWIFLKTRKMVKILYLVYSSMF